MFIKKKNSILFCSQVLFKVVSIPDEGLESARIATDVLYSDNIEYFKKLDPKEVKNVLKGSTVVEYKFRPGINILDFTLDIRCFVNKRMIFCISLFILFSTLT